MTIKLMLLKSGEDIIADISEMGIGENDDRRVVGYILDKPCIVKMRNPNLLSDQEQGIKKAGFEVSLFPWMLLSKEEKIPVPADWLITMVEPVTKLKEMYIEDVVNRGKNNQDNITTEQSNSDNSD